jgi:hypothetical protein
MDILITVLARFARNIRTHRDPIQNHRSCRTVRGSSETTFPTYAGVNVGFAIYMDLKILL